LSVQLVAILTSLGPRRVRRPSPACPAGIQVVLQSLLLWSSTRNARATALDVVAEASRLRLTKQEVRDVVDVYIRAWVEQDPNLIVTIFTDTATYHERVLEAPVRDRDGIRAYWQAKVVESQANIKCELLNLYLDGDTAIVEWEAQFDDMVEKVRKRMREVAILRFEGRQIASLREYWSSDRIPHLDTEIPATSNVQRPVGGRLSRQRR
jgi:hypothetical protein